MNTLIIYDSVYGSTERIAQAIGTALTPLANVRVLPVSGTTASDLAGVDLLVVGGPTHNHGMSDNMHTFIENLPHKALQHISVATFDTRRQMSPLISGSAARIFSGKLRRLGGREIAPAQSFFVTDTVHKEKVQGEKTKTRESALNEGELERAAEWAKEVYARYSQHEQRAA